MRRRRAVSLALAVLFAVSALAPVGGAALAADAERVQRSGRVGPTEISSCTDITESGEYALTGRIDNESATTPSSGLGACISIAADDVTLRGRGHTVAGGGSPGVVGVLVQGPKMLSNVTVRNLRTTGWGAGVAAVGVRDATFRNVSAIDNLGDGFFVERAPNATLVDATARGGNTGVFLRNADGVRVVGGAVVDNIAGVTVERSNRATVTGANVSRNRRYGVGVFDSVNATVADATVAANGFAGVALSRADRAVVRNVTVAAPTVGAEDSVGVLVNDSRNVDLVDVELGGGVGWPLYATGGSTVVGERVELGGETLSFDLRDVALDAADATPPLPADRRIVGGPFVATPTGESANLRLSVGYLDRAGTAGESGREPSGAPSGEAPSLWRFGPDGWTPLDGTSGDENGGESGVEKEDEGRDDAESNLASATLGDLDENGTVVAVLAPERRNATTAPDGR